MIKSRRGFEKCCKNCGNVKWIDQDEHNRGRNEEIEVRIDRQKDGWTQIETDHSFAESFYDYEFRGSFIVILSLEPQKIQWQPNSELRLMNENSLGDELVEYITSNDSLMRWVKKLKFYWTLPHKTIKNLLNNLSKSYQYRKSLKYLKGTDLVSEAPKVYILKPQSFSITEY